VVEGLFDESYNSCAKGDHGGKIKSERKCRSKEWRQASAPGKNFKSKEARSLEGRKECDIYA